MIVQFVRIILKILASYLHDQTKLFLDNLRVKGPKITYNNEKLVFKIRCYVVEYIQNLDKVLADLERVKVTIFKAKSQFCWAGIKIIRYIYDKNSRHLDISKVLNIFDWSECTNTILAQAFLGIYVYY